MNELIEADRTDRVDRAGIVETTNNPQIEFSEDFSLVDTIIGNDLDYKEWIDRIHKRFDTQPNGQLGLIKVNSNIVGFFIISDYPPKLGVWSDEFLTNGWIDKPISPNNAVQFAYFYIKENFRGKGVGTQALIQVIDQLKQQGKNEIYGFTKFEKRLSFYISNGAVKLGQRNHRNGGVYYAWL